MDTSVVDVSSKPANASTPLLLVVTLYYKRRFRVTLGSKFAVVENVAGWGGRRW